MVITVPSLCLSTLHTGCTKAVHRLEFAVRLCLSTLHMGCTAALPDGTEVAYSLPQHTLYGLHPLVTVFPLTVAYFASAHFIWAAPAKLHRDMDTAL